ncbi:MAG: hypothetical protein Q8O88_00935 [bacterium]|nr:hypothetical protein [bacterium]
MVKYKCTTKEGRVFLTDDSIAASICDMMGGKVEIGDFFDDVFEPPKKIVSKERKSRHQTA